MTSLNRWHYPVDPQQVMDLARARGRIGHAASLQVQEELVRFNLSCLVQEGALRQETVEFEGRQSRLMKLQLDHPRVRDALEGL